MSSERGKLQVPPLTSANQALAANPDWSIWVSANAGSGKTYVLTRRVLRLLLAGVKPETILCLTYTKAAAAEMRRRVAGSLADWAVMDETALSKTLADLEGRVVSTDLLARARTLFAKALETPGGLKIVTIHAFCESVLHRFPLEAQVPFDFSVIEDDERTGMVLAAREAVLAQGLGAAGAVETLFETLSNSQIEEAINAALSDGRKLKAVLADPEVSRANLRMLLGADDRHAADVAMEIVADTALTPKVWREIVTLFEGKTDSGTRLVDMMARLDPERLTARQLCGLFVTEKSDGTRGPRANLLNAGQRKQRPDFADLLVAEQERVMQRDGELLGLELVARSEAVLEIVAAIARRYEASKRARSLLDFDDLVEKLAELFETESADWVRYKLDAGIDHILVDESQDTNGEQWRVVKAIAEEFFAGAGAAQRPRSLFAVGDQKQSIYSFQGAEPRLFGETGQLFSRQAGAVEAPFRALPLHTSFRTLPEILKAVDLVSDQPHIQAALLESEKVHHDTARTMTGGSVTLWPPLQQLVGAPISSEWPISQLETERTAPRQVAERIAREIKNWVSTGRPLTGRGRAVEADDVLILVQTRGVLFHEIIRALRDAQLPTPGADRLDVTGHIGVMDLIALCDVLFNPADDLQLAALLRSPLFEVSEDDLYALAQPRPRGETLWQALGHSALPSCQVASEQLGRWHKALDFERPFEFLAQVLYAEGGLKRFHARLGYEVDDVFAELLTLALDHEQSPQPSLQGFVSELRARSVSVKRELAESGSGVRVMTVHGAKGLESPIVILADASRKPSPQKIGKPVYLLADSPGPLLIHAASSKHHGVQTLPIKQQSDGNLGAEYWRLLYVGMTRAEDELYVTGALTPGADASKQLAGSWYEAVEAALRPHAESVMTEDVETAVIYPRERVAPAPAATVAAGVVIGATPLVLAALPAYVAVPTVAPSSARAHVAPIIALDSLAEQVRDADAARRQGIALHALLQHLGKVDRNLWASVVPKALDALLPDTPEEHQPLAEKALSILGRPELAGIFGANSRPEIPFLIDALCDGTPIRLTGRIDRLVIDDSGVLVVDYKSDAQVPAGAEGVPPAYRTQLGLYALVAGQLLPGLPVRAAILWTGLELLMNLPSDLLAASTKGFTMR